MVVELHDLTSDPSVAEETLTELAQDPDVVGGILAPFSDFSADVLERIAAAEFPVVSMSPNGPLLGSAAAPWRRLVAPGSVQARTFAEFLRSLPGEQEHDCVAGPAGAGRLMPELARSLDVSSPTRFALEVPPDDAVPDPPILDELAEEVDAAACRIAVWTGGPQSGGAFRIALTDAGLARVIVAGTDAMRSGEFIEAAGPATNGVLAACACVDLATSTSIDAQRFVNDFQFTAGAPPRSVRGRRVRRGEHPAGCDRTRRNDSRGG